VTESVTERNGDPGFLDVESGLMWVALIIKRHEEAIDVLLLIKAAVRSTDTHHTTAYG
jgi:hypothetical protein